jgi:PAS domain S-box-containing protein
LKPESSEPAGPERAVSASGARAPEFDIGRDLLCTSDATGYFTSLNVGWERLLGWTREELMARRSIEFVHPEDAERTAAEAAKVTNPDQELVDFENRYRCRDGSYRWLQWSARSDGTTWFAIAFDVTERKETEKRLRGVLTDEFLLAYSQPILDQLGVLAQEELLVRMRAPDGDGRVIGADEFVPDAERTGLIGIVDRWMARRGLVLAEAGRVAEVNLSGASIGDEGLTAELASDLEVAGEGAGRVIFEVTETTAIENLDAARAFADRVAALGCRFALDDFGTGFGSVTYLRHLPVDYLKIDTSFVQGASERPEDLAVIRAIVAMAREMGARTVAEGIEDTETLRLLHDCGVDYCQGFLLGRPAPLPA